MANKHTISDLYQMQSLPLEAKIKMTENRIRIWYEEFDGNVYVARSGGKDSDVLGHIVKRMYPDVPHVFVNTGLEFDSVRMHGMEVSDEVLRPQMSFLEVITSHGYPVISKEVSDSIEIVQKAIRNEKKPSKTRIDKLNGTYIDKKTGELSNYNIPKWKFLLDAPFRISGKCCDVMKKNPSKYYEHETKRNPFIGTMADESRLRKTKWLQFGCNAFEQKRPTSQPLSFWTEQDILTYIHAYNLKIADVYGDIGYLDKDGFLYYEPLFIGDMQLTTTGEKRTGCVFCMFGITQDTDRFLRLKEIEPKKYDYVMRGGKFDEKGLWIPHNGLGYKFVIDWINENGDMNIKY